MTGQPDRAAGAAGGDRGATRAPWVPLIVIVLAQLQMAINLSVLPVSLGPIAEDLDSSASVGCSGLPSSCTVRRWR